MNKSERPKRGELCRIERSIGELTVAIRRLSLEIGAMMSMEITGGIRLALYGTQVKRVIRQVIWNGEQ